MSAPPLLAVDGLTVEFAGPRGALRAVDRVSFTVAAGETLALVGESGAGKSATALAVMGLLPAPGARIAAGRIAWRGRDLAGAGERAWRRVRGAEIAMIFQDPASALNPVRTIAAQIAEVLRRHEGVGRRPARRRAQELLERVAVGARRGGAFPHELSAGMCQRALIAMAIAAEPALLIADEPTSALDVTVSAQVLALLAELRPPPAATLLITHDLGVVAAAADRVMVMYAGRVVEVGSAEAVLTRPAHPYTRGLLAARPRLDAPAGHRPLSIPGTSPSPLRRPSGCAFHPRCPIAEPRCATIAPELEPAGGAAHLAACHLAGAPR